MLPECSVCGASMDRQRKYCSAKCKSRASYLRARESGAYAASQERRKQSGLCGCGRTDMAARGLCTACYKRANYRPARVIRNLTCLVCESAFAQTGPGIDRKYCSRRCRRAAEPATCKVTYARCDWCGNLFVRQGAAACCSDECRRERDVLLRAGRVEAYRASRFCPDCSGALPKDAQRCELCAAIHNAATERRNRRAGEAIRRARLRAAIVERFDPVEVFERDGWVCGMCSLPVDPGLRVPHPDAPTLDHVVPLARGGEHSRANTQLAHFLCNSRKGARELAASNG